MASVSKKMKEGVTCFICMELMQEPMITDCGHSFCHWCVVGLFEKQTEISSLETHHCPQCQSPLKRENLRPNKHLKNIIETIKEMDSERVCEKHGERLHLFCEDDQQLICWHCERSPQHRRHVITLVEETCQKYTDKIALTIQKIQSDFNNIHYFLNEEEKSYLWRLEKEKEQTLRRLQNNLACPERQSQEPKKQNRKLEKKCQDWAQKLLKDKKDTLNRKSVLELENPELISLEIQTPDNVSELYLDVKKILRRYQVNITLDEDTAHDCLILSDNLRTVNHQLPQKKHDNPKRFMEFPCVLGSESFTSGRHYFEVDVGKAFMWDLGVCLENVGRNIKDRYPENGFWTIRLSKWNGYEALTLPLTPLTVREPLRTVGVFLDFEAGLVSFYNMGTSSHIFTFPKASFSEGLRPYFWVYFNCPLFLPLPDE